MNCYCGAKGDKHIGYSHFDEFENGEYITIRIPKDETGLCHCDCHEKDILEEI